MKSTLFFFITFSFIFINLTASFANKDSLWTIWEDESQVDTVRLDALYNLTAKYYYLNKPDSAVILFNKYLDYAEAIEQDERIALGLRLVGASYQMSGNNELSLSYFQKAYDKSLEVGNMDGAVKSLLNMNIVYNSLGKWKEVVESSEKLLPKLEATQDWENISTLNSTLFNIYSDRGLHEEALKIALENYDLIPRIDESYHLTIIRDLGRCYDEVGEFNQAKKYYLKTLALAEKRGENTYVLSTLEMLLDFSTSEGDTSNVADYILKGERLASALKGSQSAITWKYELGDYYMTNGMYRKAESLFETAITSAKLSNIVYLIPYLEHAIGMNALKMSNFEKATENCKKSYDSSKNQLQNEKMTQLNCDCLHKAYKALGQATKALPYLEESYALRDSLFNEETTKATTRLTMQYEFDQEKQETDLLYQAELQRQSFIQYGLLGGLSLLALLAFVIYRNYRNTAKTKQVIEAQKNELEELNATKDRLFAIIGHDLRKPSIAFRGIGKKVDYLLEEQDYDTLGNLSQTLEKAAFSLNNLLDNLLNWALQQRNVLPYQPQVIDVAK
ncbi:MAG: tetratricopeptide repeat protein, partial [Bacteroidota bacterium]